MPSTDIMDFRLGKCAKPQQEDICLQKQPFVPLKNVRKTNDRQD